MSADLIIEDVTAQVARRFGKPRQHGKARIITFGSALSCSINYSKLLHGNKYFFGLPTGMIDPGQRPSPYEVRCVRLAYLWLGRDGVGSSQRLCHRNDEGRR